MKPKQSVLNQVVGHLVRNQVLAQITLEVYEPAWDYVVEWRLNQIVSTISQAPLRKKLRA